MNLKTFGEYIKEGVLYLVQEKVPILGDGLGIHKEVARSRWERAITGEIDELKSGFKRVLVRFDEVYKIVKDLLRTDETSGLALMKCAFPASESARLLKEPEFFGAKVLGHNESPQKHAVQVVLPEKRIEIPRGTASSLLDERSWDQTGEVLQSKNVLDWFVRDPNSTSVKMNEHTMGKIRFTLLHCGKVGDRLFAKIEVENVDDKSKKSKNFSVTGASRAGVDGVTYCAQKVQFGTVASERGVFAEGRVNAWLQHREPEIVQLIFSVGKPIRKVEFVELCMGPSSVFFEDIQLHST